MLRLLRTLTLVTLVAAACSTEGGPTTTAPPTTGATTTAPVTTTTSEPSTTTSTPATVVPEPTNPFPSLSPSPIPTGPAWSGPDWPNSLGGVAFADVVPSALQARLASDGFAIDGSETSTHLAWLYLSLYPYGGRPVFVTTDAAYHQWHLVFDKILRDAEEQSLLPVLERFTLSMLDGTRAQADDLAGTAFADAADRAVQYFEAVATVLELDVGPTGDLARAEVDLVMAHTFLGSSPTMGGDCSAHPGSCVDYSLMTPRGHYTRTEGLTRYFRAMSLLGNAGAAIDDPDALLTAVMISRVLTTDEQRAADWATIYYPTAFLVGTADDYTPFEIGNVAVESVLGQATAAEQQAVLQRLLATIAASLAARRPVLINPENASVRTMGVRFVFDSWVFDQLVYPSVPDRMRVSPLDLAAVFGSDWAFQRQDEAGETGYTGYTDQIDTLRAATEARTIGDWSATVYDAWLYAIQPSLLACGDAYPPFMRTDAWAAKSLQAGLGSYTELKHDTILYAKQGLAEGDMEPPPVVTHWVEPDPVVFHRLAGLATLLRDGLTEMNLLPGSPDEYGSDAATLDTLITVLERLGSIADQELAGTPISSDDNDFLGQIGGWFESILYGSATEGAIDDHGGLVADVFLDASTDAALELGTGDFNPIYVVVPDGSGGWEIATGGVYAYYEFWQPRTDRLTDEAWWSWIEQGTLPDRPDWASEFLGL
jgi:hypothetical protein